MSMLQWTSLPYMKRLCCELLLDVHACMSAQGFHCIVISYVYSLVLYLDTLDLFILARTVCPTRTFGPISDHLPEI